MKHSLLYLSSSVILLIILQVFCSYDYLYAEQFRLFLFSKEYAEPFFTRAGGPVAYLSGFFLQFFAKKWLGPIIITVMFFLFTMGVDGLLKSISRNIPLPAFALTAGIMLTALSTELRYSMDASWAIVLSVVGMTCYARVGKNKSLWALPFTLLIYYIVGVFAMVAVAYLFAISIARKEKKEAIALLVGLAIIIVHLSINAENDYLHVWTMDAYYFSYFHASKHSYWVIGVLTLGLVTALLLRNHSCEKYPRHLYCIQILIGIGIGSYFFYLCHRDDSYTIKKLEVLRWNEEWDKILSEDLPTAYVPLFANYQNMALAAKGKLGDELIDHPQAGPLGLQQVWKGYQAESDIMSDIFIQQGHVAMAQKMAFIAMQYNQEQMHGRLLLRLIETNLILGSENVALKYIRILEQTLFYAEKAREYRKYIGHPELISSDKRLGELQRCAEGCDCCPNDFEQGLAMIIEANPSYKNALHYLGAFYLMQKDVTPFKSFLDKYYDYPGLKPMPESFQKAANQIGWKKPVKTETEQ